MVLSSRSEYTSGVTHKLVSHEQLRATCLLSNCSESDIVVPSFLLVSSSPQGAKKVVATTGLASNPFSEEYTKLAYISYK